MYGKSTKRTILCNDFQITTLHYSTSSVEVGENGVVSVQFCSFFD